VKLSWRIIYIPIYQKTLTQTYINKKQVKSFIFGSTLVGPQGLVVVGRLGTSRVLLLQCPRIIQIQAITIVFLLTIKY